MGVVSDVLQISTIQSFVLLWFDSDKFRIVETGHINILGFLVFWILVCYVATQLANNYDTDTYKFCYYTSFVIRTQPEHSLLDSVVHVNTTNMLNLLIRCVFQSRPIHRFWTWIFTPLTLLDFWVDSRKQSTLLECSIAGWRGRRPRPDPLWIL